MPGSADSGLGAMHRFRCSNSVLAPAEAGWGTEVRIDSPGLRHGVTLYRRFAGLIQVSGIQSAREQEKTGNQGKSLLQYRISPRFAGSIQVSWFGTGLTFQSEGASDGVKLVFPSGSPMLRRNLILACLCCVWPFSLAAQSNSGNTQNATQDLHPVNDGVAELRVTDPSVNDQTVPDAPTLAKKSTVHGSVDGLKGLVLMNAPYAGSTPYRAQRGDLPVWDVGGIAGGDLGQGRTSYFASFDRFDLNQQKLEGFLTTLQRRGGTGELPIDLNPASFHQLSAGVDQKISQRELFYVRFNRDDLESYKMLPPQNGGVQTLGSDVHMTQQTIGAGNLVTISPSTVDATTAQFITSQIQLPPGAEALGIVSFLPTIRQYRILHAANDVNRQVGNGNLRIGGDFLDNQFNISFLESRLGNGSGNSSFHQPSRSGDLYFESQKRVQPNLTLTSGIGYDLEALNGFRTDTHNVAPQFGVAWAPTQRTVIRGGAGVSYDQIPLPAIAGQANATDAADIERSGRFVSRNGHSPDQVGSFTTESPTMQEAYAEHADIAVEQQVGASGVLTAESQYVRGVQLPLPTPRSAALCSASSACTAGSASWDREISSGAVSTYSGESLTFTQQPTRWSSYNIAYAYANAHGYGTGANDSDVQDLMRRASFTGALHTSTEPASDFRQRMTNGFALAATGSYATRSEFAGMSFFDLDARLTKALAWGEHYHLDAMAETFNSMLRTSTALAQTAGQMGAEFADFFATYQKVAALQGVNGAQAGLRLSF